MLYKHRRIILLQRPITRKINNYTIMINMTGWGLGTPDTYCCQVFVCVWQIWQQRRALKRALKELSKLVFRLLLEWRSKSENQRLGLKKNQQLVRGELAGRSKSSTHQSFILRQRHGRRHYLYKNNIRVHEAWCFSNINKESFQTNIHYVKVLTKWMCVRSVFSVSGNSEILAMLL